MIPINTCDSRPSDVLPGSHFSPTDLLRSGARHRNSWLPSIINTSGRLVIYRKADEFAYRI
jgi:hypothetical protein